MDTCEYCYDGVWFTCHFYDIECDDDGCLVIGPCPRCQRKDAT